MRRKNCVIALILAVLAIGAVVFLMSGDSSPSVAADESTSSGRKGIQTVKPAKAGRKAKVRDGAAKRKSHTKAKKASDDEKPKLNEDDDGLSPEHRKVADALQEALDVENFKAVQRATALAIASKNPKLLKKAVEACKWFGSKSLAELTSIAAACAQGSAEASRNSGADAGKGSSSEDGENLQAEFEEAEQFAFEGIEEKLGEIENDAEKAALVREYMKATSDADMLTLLEGQLNTVLDEKLAIEAAIDVIENGSAAAAEHAKAVYEFQTSETYTGREAAQQWLNENYTPPDAD